MSELLRARGAFIVDADLVAREVVQPDGLAYDGLVARFGVEVLHPDGTLNRPALAAIVFNDADALKDLNGITHPAINHVIAERVAQHVGTDHIVILDAALLFDTARVGIVGKMVVDVDVEVAVARLVTYRGLTEEDARARIRSQMSREERLAMADFVIGNDGEVEALEARVDTAWEWIATLPDSPVGAGRPVSSVP